ncbi:hypothetical protein [Streptomyces sp. NPDC091879]|uniref:hypothetical protein n=1 Tax=Streptomyces sp. NPDC091879 TaxID=3366006 RepID=UPI0037FE47D7
MTTPGGSEIPPHPDGLNPEQSSINNSGTSVQVGRDNTGIINITRRPKLPHPPVPRSEREAALEPRWAHTPTPQRAVNIIANHGLAVIIGERGSGRRISAIRSLHTYLDNPSKSPQIFDLAADWDEEEVPEREVLPEPAVGHGYIIDATARVISEPTARALTVWAEKLHSQGAGLVIIVNQGEWRGDNRFEIVAQRPDAGQVARNHLTFLAYQTQAQWLQPDPQRTLPRGLLRQQTPTDPTIGVLADVITPSVGPSDAIAIAERLRTVAPERVSRAVELRDRPSNTPTFSVDHERGLSELRGIREEVLLWTGFLEKKLTDAGTRGEDRVMLLSAAYLEGAPLELCIKAATAFGPRDERAAKRYREGRSPRRRLRDVGVDVSNRDTAAFDSRPGLALSAIRMDWHHWADERGETTRWLTLISSPDGLAAAWAEQIGIRLLDLSRTAVEAPFFAVLDSWLGLNPDDKRIDVIARLMTQAAETPELSRDTHKRLLEWAKKAQAHRKVVAHVCAGRYGIRWPHMALTRLRHILAMDDSATQIAANALEGYAGKNGDGLNRIVDTVESWFERYPGHSAGPRAFLVLADPAYGMVDRLVSAAYTVPTVRDFLVSGWMQTLENTEVRDNAYQVLLGWAGAAYEGRLERNATFGILTDVRNAHTPVDAMSRFLYGNPDKDERALIEARLCLANLRSCNHAECSEPACPLRQRGEAPSSLGIAREGLGEFEA